MVWAPWKVAARIGTLQDTTLTQRLHKCQVSKHCLLCLPREGTKATPWPVLWAESEWPELGEQMHKVLTGFAEVFGIKMAKKKNFFLRTEVKLPIRAPCS